MKKIIFRADASSDIGYGHFIRSLALADMLRNNFDCYFATVAPSDYQINEIAKVCKLITLSDKIDHFSCFLSLLNGDEIVVLDNYFFTTEYQKQIKDKGCKLVCIDDMHDKHYVADVVINHGLNDSKLFNTEQYTKLCLGLNWAMLRKPFLTKPIIVKIKPIGSIAVCFGGVDKLNLNRKVVELLTKLPHISKIEIIGGYDTMPYDNLPANIILKTYRNVDADQIVSIFKNNDCAILSASTICIEALACSIPVIAGYYVDNQVGLYNYLNNSKYIYGIGNILEPEALNKKLPEYISVSNFNLQKDINLDFSSVSENYINLFRGLC